MDKSSQKKNLNLNFQKWIGLSFRANSTTNFFGMRIENLIFATKKLLCASELNFFQLTGEIKNRNQLLFMNIYLQIAG